jgi:hypothetical protein
LTGDPSFGRDNRVVRVRNSKTIVMRKRASLKLERRTMENDRKKRVCPVERAGSLDSRIRRWFQNPNAGFVLVERPKVTLSKTALLIKN